MNLLELDRFMTKAAEKALFDYFDATKGAAPRAQETIKRWQGGFRAGNQFSMDCAVVEASHFTGQPVEVCRRWLAAYAPVCAVSKSLRLVD